MPLDAFCLSAVCNELSGQITGSKIDKIGQPESDVLIFALRGTQVPVNRLLISAGSGDARIHLTNYQFENPPSPPMFCMLLRKHLLGARITGISQLPAERVIKLKMSAVSAIGDISEKCLIIEFIGSVSNIVLVNNEGIIIDCLRRISLDKSGKRAVLPGLIYLNPALQEDKSNPLELKCLDDLFAKNNRDISIDKWLLSNFYGLSPLICREISFRAYGTVDLQLKDISDNGEKLKREFFELINAINTGAFEACLLRNKDDNRPYDFSFTGIKQYEDAMDIEIFESFSGMLENYYTNRAKSTRIKQRASDTIKAVRTARDRLIRKLVLQKAELESTASRDYLRQCGDIIMANLHLMKKGQKELVAMDFYATDGDDRKIKLDPLKSPQENAARYYKKYTKAKTAEKYLSEQIEFGEKELEYLESVLEAIIYAEGEYDIQEIRNELISTGYMRAARTPKTHKADSKKRASSSVKSTPMKFISSTGMQILAGKNNIQNDKLTLKTANKSDMWLHAQKIHGSHVVISCSAGIPDETTLYEAATIAAHYSAARASNKVPVDYTLVRHVKKLTGGRPGMVIYTNFKTISVSPDEQLVNRLRRS